MGDIAFAAQRLRKRYVRGGEYAVKGIDFTVHRGEYVAIMGKSGSGKSTLLHMLAGLDAPSEGDVAFGEENLARKSEAQLALFRRKHIGFVHQAFHLIESMTALENVLMPALLLGVGYKESKRRCDTLFAQLDIQGLENQLPAAVSGGQKQRIAIARALINAPTVIFADEPTGSLDTQTS